MLQLLTRLSLKKAAKPARGAPSPAEAKPSLDEIEKEFFSRAGE